MLPATPRDSRPSPVSGGFSWDLPSTDELQFNFRLTHGRVEHGLPDAGRGSGSIGVEQFENPPLARLVADLRDPLDLAGGGGRRRPISLRHLTAIDDRRAPPDDLRPKCLAE